MMIGTILGDRYELIEKIGEGGMAEVYKAKCHKLNRFDAVKILKKEFASDSDLVEKFKKEATAVANLSDNNIVNIFDVGTQEDIHYIVMEYVKGKTLKQVIRENGRLSYTKAIDIAIQISKALDCAHRSNIIHRDVKPQNILVTEEGVVKVTDFGIAKSPDSATITNSNRILGSAHYFSPEQAKGTYIDCRTDLYSLGIVLYEMITGRVPFDAESPVSVALKHIQEPVVPPKQLNEEIPESLNKLILKAIEKEPIKRYQSARELLNDLIKIQQNPNSEIVYNNIDEDYTRIMKPVNIPSENYNKPSKKEYDEEEYEEDYEDKKEGIGGKKKKYIILSLIGVLVIALGVLTAAVISKGMIPKKDKAIEVPKIVGLSKEEAEKLLSEKGLKMEVGGTEKSDKPEGTVLKSSPEEGKLAKSDMPVTVVLSGGKTYVKVPELKEIDLKSAKEMLTNRELVVGNISQEFSDTIPTDAVISQDPAADTQVDKGAKVNLVVSKGPEVKLMKVPQLINSNISDAENALKNSKLNINKQSEETTDKNKDQKVFSQSIEANVEVKQGTTVTVKYYIYKEPQEVQINIPDFNGKTLEEAKNIAAQNNINLGIPNGAKDNDVVAAQDPAAGSIKVKPGTKVTVNLTLKPAPPKPAPPQNQP